MVSSAVGSLERKELNDGPLVARYVNIPAEMESCGRLRFDYFCTARGWVQDHPEMAGLDIDRYDCGSHHLGVFEGGRVVAYGSVSSLCPRRVCYGSGRAAPPFPGHCAGASLANSQDNESIIDAGSCGKSARMEYPEALTPGKRWPRGQRAAHGKIVLPQPLDEVADGFAALRGGGQQPQAVG